MFRSLHFKLGLLFLLPVFNLAAQDSLVNLRITDTLAAQIKLCAYDKLGNTYAVDAGNRLLKFDSDAKRVSTLNYSYSGNIAWLDASNPLEILLFYPEMNSLAVVDNNLALKGRFELSSYEIVQASAVGRAYDNGFWVFDSGDMTLKKLGRDAEVNIKSGNLLQFSNGLRLSPQFILDNGERVLLVDSVNGFFVFDVFGQFIKRIPIQGAIWAETTRMGISFLADGQQVWYDFQSLERRYSPLPFRGIKAIKQMPKGTSLILVKDYLLLARTKK